MKSWIPYLLLTTTIFLFQGCSLHQAAALKYEAKAHFVLDHIHPVNGEGTTNWLNESDSEDENLKRKVMYLNSEVSGLLSHEFRQQLESSLTEEEKNTLLRPYLNNGEEPQVKSLISYAVSQVHIASKTTDKIIFWGYSSHENEGSSIIANKILEQYPIFREKYKLKEIPLYPGIDLPKDQIPELMLIKAGPKTMPPLEPVVKR